MSDDFVIRADCRHYRGDKPCRPGKLCAGCNAFDPVKERLLVVKLAAVGDVLRTTPLLRALRERFPQGWVTWVTDPDAAVLLRGNPLIDEVVVFGVDGLLPLAAREFHWVGVFDKEPRAAALGTLARAREKVGFGLDRGGRLAILNQESGYALRLGLDDDLKYRGNRLTYPAIVFGMCGYPYRGEEYALGVAPDADRAARELLAGAGWLPGAPTVGLNTGCGPVFSGKKWSEEGFVAVAEGVGRMGAQVVLLGGPAERERNRRIRERAAVPVADPGCDNPLDVFAGIIGACDVVVTGDTLALHVAVGLQREVVLLMGPTAPAEIDLFGRGEILRAEHPCAPCYRRDCPDGDPAPCMAAIPPDEVLAAVGRSLARLRGDRA